ncbi:MAG: hypothetical protein JRI80_08035 [Deltaproteobacteria bacterium]|nr:hypothetical protein [Deltaproteobacteria bacterium]
MIGEGFQIMRSKMNEAGVHQDQAKESSDETAGKEKSLEKRDLCSKDHAGE